MTRYRKKILESQHLARMRSVYIGVAEKNGFQLLEFNSEQDHVHLLLKHPPALSIANLVNHLETGPYPPRP